jgi:hypothetical protein
MGFRKELPDGLATTSFLWQDGIEAGLSVKQLRNGRLARPSRGVRVPRQVPLALADKVRALSWITPESALSHGTAARLWEFPLPHWLAEDDEVHISRPASCSAARRRDVVGHRAQLLPGETAVHLGVRLTSRTKTWLDLAHVLRVEDLVIIGDHLVRRPRQQFENRSEPYTTIGELRGIISRHRGKRGISKAAEAVELVRVGADSAPETRLRLALVDAGLPEPELNQPLVDSDGRSWHSPDMQYRQYKIAIEYEGDHHRSAEQLARDIKRGENTAAAGWLERRITKDDMADDARTAVAKIRRALLDRGWQPGKHPSARTKKQQMPFSAQKRASAAHSTGGEGRAAGLTP